MLLTNVWILFPKADDIRDACSGRFQKLSDKIQELKDVNQRMVELGLRCQNDRGAEMGM